jgi:hypothetical protein
MGDLTKGEVQQRLRNLVLLIQEVPIQGFSGGPAGSFSEGFCNIEVKFSARFETRFSATNWDFLRGHRLWTIHAYCDMVPG